MGLKAVCSCYSFNCTFLPLKRLQLACEQENSALGRLICLKGPTRCFPFWQEVMACYVINSSVDDNKAVWKCHEQLEDYLECLHHAKEVRFYDQFWDGNGCSPSRTRLTLHRRQKE
jgi:hypothetical protein